MNIGWDAHLDRELDRYYKEHEEAERLQRIEEIKKEISDLEDELYELPYEEDEP